MQPLLLKGSMRPRGYGNAGRWPQPCRKGAVALPVRIGVVDTGIDQSHPWVGGRVVGGIGVRYESHGCELVPNFQDLIGHGTAVASLIHAFCPQAVLYSIRIAAQEGGRDGQYVQERAMARGIRWCLDQRIGIINVSYSLKGTPENGGLVHEVCQQAHERHAVIVAAHRNGGRVTVYPAAFRGAIGVHCRRDLKPGQISILSEENRDLVAYGGPCYLAHMGNSVQHIGGTSIACAQVSAMVGRICSIDDSFGLEGVFALLRDAAVP